MTEGSDSGQLPGLFDAVPEPDPADEGTDREPEVDQVEPTAPEALTISELNQAVREALEGSIPALWVRGEVAGWTRARSGHRYFTLKDEDAELRCVMWRGDAERLPADPDEGMEVRAFGGPTVYEARGTYQLIVRQLQVDGEEGLWRLAFERLRRRLELEGALAPERKRSLPRHPSAVGVVTSATGAAFHDIVSVIRRRAPWTRILLRASRVQGEGAAAEVAAAIDVLGGSGQVDVLIVGRGGGSIEDLWAFNEEPVARAIERCPVPVISAVGHEVDVTIADLIADLRAPTPSAAAEAAVEDQASVAELLRAVRRPLSSALVRAAGRARARVEGAEREISRALRARLLPARRLRLARADEALARGAARGLEGGRHRLDRAKATLHALSPLATFQRGYAAAVGSDGRVLRTMEELPAELNFDLRVSDGMVNCVSRGPHQEGDDGEG